MKGDFKVEKKEIIQKLKALSERGIAGEKENATKLLEKLMKKYGITETDLKNEETKVVNVELRTDAEKKICSQILYAYFNNAPLYRRFGTKISFFTKLTKAEEIEFKYMLSVYIDSFYKEHDIFVSAFIQKNKIFPKDAPTTNINELSAEEKEKSLKASLMTQGMEYTVIRKSLEETTTTKKKENVKSSKTKANKSTTKKASLKKGE